MELDSDGVWDNDKYDTIDNRVDNDLDGLADGLDPDDTKDDMSTTRL